MPVIKKYIQEKKLVFIKGDGDIQYTESLSSIKYLANTIEAFEVIDVLIDHSKVKSIPSIVEAFNLGSMIGQKFRQLNFLVIYPSVFKEKYNMFKNAGNNRGTNIILFKNKTDAINWLTNSRELMWDKLASILESI